MSRKSATLQKKLSELESELAEAFRLSPHSESGHKILRSVEKRLVYITSLLTAEVASTPDKTDQLDEIREKLTGLEAAFHCLSEYRTYALQSLLDNAPGSICSRCIRSYLDDDGEDDSPDSPRDGMDMPLVAAPKHSPRVDGGGGGEDGRSWGGSFGKMCGAFRSGVILGAAACYIVVNYPSLFMGYPDLYFIPPT